MLEIYKTVLKECETEITEKKSRFISAVMPVKTEYEAKEFIEKIRKKHWSASHNVFAYQIGYRNEIQRSSDDGEPQGTAGKPVLDVLRGEDIKNTVVVVTRYFGGTLLGTGGLVRAYGRAAKEGVNSATVVEMIPFCVYNIIIDYSLSGKIQYDILQGEHIIVDTIYTDNVEYIVAVETVKSESFYKSITEVSLGKAGIVLNCEKYGFWVDGKIQFNTEVL